MGIQKYNEKNKEKVKFVLDDNDFFLFSDVKRL